MAGKARMRKISLGQMDEELVLWANMAAMRENITVTAYVSDLIRQDMESADDAKRAAHNAMLDSMSR